MRSIRLVGAVAVCMIWACGGSEASSGPEGRRGAVPDHADIDVIGAPYGAAAPRVRGLDAFEGRDGMAELVMERSTIEGVTITSRLIVTEGRATLFVDATADGGGVSSEAIDDLILVRFLPSRWENNVEVAKERFEGVDRETARRVPGTYLLVSAKCLREVCTATF